MANNKTAEEAIFESLSPNDLLAMSLEWEDEEIYYIWDKVHLIHDEKKKVYTIYSFTTYADWRINYTLWADNEYEMFEPWQVKHYIPSQSIWFNSILNDSTNPTNPSNPIVNRKDLGI